jgi:hypothetical protein
MYIRPELALIRGHQWQPQSFKRGHQQRWRNGNSQPHANDPWHQHHTSRNSARLLETEVPQQSRSSEPKAKRQKTQENEILAQNATLVEAASYESARLRDYSLLQHLLYAQMFASETDYTRAPQQKSDHWPAITGVLHVHSQATKSIIAKGGPETTISAVRKLNHAVKWGLCLLALGQWQVEHPELMRSRFMPQLHCKCMDSWRMRFIFQTLRICGRIYRCGMEDAIVRLAVMW